MIKRAGLARACPFPSNGVPAKTILAHPCSDARPSRKARPGSVASTTAGRITRNWKLETAGVSAASCGRFVRHPGLGENGKLVTREFELRDFVHSHPAIRTQQCLVAEAYG